MDGVWVAARWVLLLLVGRQQLAEPTTDDRRQTSRQTSHDKNDMIFEP